MSAHKLDTVPVSPRPRVAAREAKLTLASQSVRIHKNGIEFRSPAPLDTWVEMTVELDSPQATRKLECSGIVVSCAGTRDTGYVVSMLFTGMNPQSKEQLSLLAHS